MLVWNKDKIEEWVGAWPAKRNSKKICAVLVGTAHAGLDEAVYIGCFYNRKSKTYYDWYRLPKGAWIGSPPKRDR